MSTAKRLDAARQKLAQLEAASGTDETVLAYACAALGHLEATLALEKALQRSKPKPVPEDLPRILVACARTGHVSFFGDEAYAVLLEASGRKHTSVYQDKGTAIDSANLTVDGVHLYAQAPSRAATEDELAAERKANTPGEQSHA